MNKYLIASEGRIDHISAYMDGMKLYETLVKENIIGLVRGTQVFGTNKMNLNKVELFRHFAFFSPSDYPEYINLQLLANHINSIWGKLEFPRELERKSDENLFQWGERIALDYTEQLIIGALNDIKLTYIDIIHPYMSSRIIDSVWKLPDHLRAEKLGFKKIVESMTPPIPFAKAYGILSVDEICCTSFIEILKDELSSLYTRNLISNRLINFILTGLSKDENVTILKDRFINPSFARMAFRVYIIVKMNKILREDAISS